MFIGSLSYRSYASDKFNDYENVIVSVDNLFGFAMSTQTSNSNGLDFKSRDFNFSLLGNMGDKIVPRISKVGIDVFGDYGVSIGMAFMIGYNLKSRSIDNNTAYTNLALVLVNPRIGYGITFSDNIGLWSKAGFTYSKMFNGHLEEDQVWVNIDSNLVITPITGVGITGGLTFDNMINQRQISRGNSIINNSSLMSIGLQCGVLTYF
jgi:hypothetical protein